MYCIMDSVRVPLAVGLVAGAALLGPKVSLAAALLLGGCHQSWPHRSWTFSFAISVSKLFHSWII